jgi:hypothetical protein
MVKVLQMPMTEYQVHLLPNHMARLFLHYHRLQRLALAALRGA